MTEMARIGSRGGLSAAVHIRPIGLDDLSAVRYVHSRALRAHGDEGKASDAIQALAASVNSIGYTDRLMESAERGQLLGGWIGDELVATGGWSPTAARREACNIENVFVLPVYERLGVGRRVVTEVEREARRNGCQSFEVRSAVPASGFFIRLGYKLVGHSSISVGEDMVLPVSLLRKGVKPEARRKHLLN